VEALTPYRPDGLVTHTDLVLRADPARVLARLFVPGHELLPDAQSRATSVLQRILALDEPEVDRSLARVRDRFSARHRDLPGVLRAHADQIAHRLPDGAVLSAARRALLGATFTQEYAVEAAALFNPSVVAHPDQSGLPAECCRLVLSLRAVGEGHLSSVEFRTGVLGPGGQLHLDAAGGHVEAGQVRPTTHHRDLLAARLAEQGDDAEGARFLLSRLPERFVDADLDTALAALAGQRVTRLGSASTQDLARRLVSCSYEVDFPRETALDERVLWPHGPSESHGIEDARFVRSRAHDGTVTYRATYTAFDGAHITPQVIETADFRSFRLSQLAGPAARDKGMALFPRTVGGRHLALARWDRESIALATSADGRWWERGSTLHRPGRAWELVQTGTCGSPVETDAGWLVLTHGVGPMREYALGALLLDLDEPHRVLGALPEPLLTAGMGERDGYVPNVVYSCGALLHRDRLLLPYGVSDSSVRFALVDVPRLLELLTTGSLPPATRVSSAA